MGRKETRKNSHFKRKQINKEKKQLSKTTKVSKTSKVSPIVNESSTQMEFISEFYTEEFLDSLKNLDIKKRLHILKEYYPIITNDRENVNEIAKSFNVDSDILGVIEVSHEMKNGFVVELKFKEMIKHSYSEDLDDFICFVLNNYYPQKIFNSNESVMFIIRDIIYHLMPKGSLKIIKFLFDDYLNSEECLSLLNLLFNFQILFNENEQIKYFISKQQSLKQKYENKYHNFNIVDENIVDLINQIYDMNIIKKKDNIHSLVELLIEMLVEQSTKQDFHFDSEESEDIEESEENKDTIMETKNQKEEFLFYRIISFVLNNGNSSQLHFLLTFLKNNEYIKYFNDMFTRIHFYCNVENLFYLIKNYKDEIKNLFLNNNIYPLSIFSKCTLKQLEEIFILLDFDLSNFVVKTNYLRKLNFTYDEHISEKKKIKDIVETYSTRCNTIFHYIIPDSGKKNIELIEAFIKKYYYCFDDYGQRKFIKYFKYFLNNKWYHNNDMIEYMYSRVLCSINDIRKSNILDMLVNFDEQTQQEILKYFIFDSDDKDSDLLYFHFNDLIKNMCSKQEYIDQYVVKDDIIISSEFQQNFDQFLLELYEMYFSKNVLQPMEINIPRFEFEDNSVKLTKDVVKEEKNEKLEEIILTDTIDDKEECTFYKSIKSVYKNIKSNLIDSFMNYGSVKIFNRFCNEILEDSDFPNDDKLKRYVLSNKNVSCIKSYYEMIQLTDTKKNEIEKELRKYSRYINYHFKDNKINIIDIINYLFDSKNKENNYNISPLKYVLSKNPSLSNMRDSDYNRLIKMMDVELFEIILNIIKTDKYLFKHQLEMILSLIYKHNKTDLIMYMKEHYSKEFKKNFDLGCQTQIIDVDSLNSLVEEGCITLDDNFVGNYVYNLFIRKIDEEREEKIMIFLRYLFYHVSPDNYKKIIWSSLEHLSKTHTNSMNIMNFLYLKSYIG